MLKEYLEEDPSDPFLHFAIAKEYEKQADLSAAQEKYQYLVTDHPDYVGTYYHFGKLLVTTGELVQARTTYAKGIEIAESQKDAHSKSELEGALVEIEDAT